MFESLTTKVLLIHSNSSYTPLWLGQRDAKLFVEEGEGGGEGAFINIREARGASSTSSLSLSSQPKCLELSIQVYWVKEPSQLVEQHRSRSEYVCFRCGNQPTGIHTHTHTPIHTHTHILTIDA